MRSSRPNWRVAVSDAFAERRVLRGERSHEARHVLGTGEDAVGGARRIGSTDINTVSTLDLCPPGSPR
jgi:hypothetical protein